MATGTAPSPTAGSTESPAAVLDPRAQFSQGIVERAKQKASKKSQPSAQQAPSEPAAAVQDTPPAAKPSETASTTTTESSGPDAAPPPDTKPDEKQAPTPEELRKQLTAQTNANLRLGRELQEEKRRNKELQNQVTRIEQKLDGTYKEPPKEEAEARRMLDDFDRRSQASRDVAVQKFGEEFVSQTIDADGSPYKTLAVKRPYLANRIIFAEEPVIEAITVVQEEDVLVTFGRTRKDVLAKAKEMLRTELFQEFTKEMSGTGSGGARVPGLSRAAQAQDTTRTGEAGAGKSGRFSVRGFNKHNAVP